MLKHFGHSLTWIKSAGLKPIVTCSPKNFALVKSLGAVAAFDYHSPTCAEDIRAYTKNALDYAIDCITTEATMKLCYAAIGRAGGRYCALDPFPQRAHTRKVIHPDWILATRVRGEDCIWPEPFGAKGNPKTRAFADELWVGVTPLLQSGKLKFHPLRHMEGAFEGILEGLNILRRGEVSGQKLVYTLDGGDRA
jgi:NADPH:quinone reductase-like Zn-dependent oxidoreductase